MTTLSIVCVLYPGTMSIKKIQFDSILTSKLCHLRTAVSLMNLCLLRSVFFVASPLLVETAQQIFLINGFVSYHSNYKLTQLFE